MIENEYVNDDGSLKVWCVYNFNKKYFVSYHPQVQIDDASMAIKFYSINDAYHCGRNHNILDPERSFEICECSISNWHLIKMDYELYKQKGYNEFYTESFNILEQNCSNQVQRQTVEYKKWRLDVFRKDSFKCQACGTVGAGLNAHHIKPFAKYKALRCDLDNGITLCEKCHKELHKKEREI